VPGFDPATEEMQLHSFLRILVPNDLKRYRHVDTNTQLLEQLPPETFFQCFTWLALPAWKLPETCQMHTRIPSGNQIAALTINKTGSDFNDLHAAPSLLATSDRKGTSCTTISSDIADRRDFVPCSRSP